MFAAPPSASQIESPQRPVRVLERYVAAHGEELEVVACPLCDHAQADLALEARDLSYPTPGRYRVVRCRACSLAFVNPRPTLAALAQHYPDDYHCYRPIEATPRILRPLARLEIEQQARARLRAIERVLGRIRPEMELLDLGCGRNTLLQLIARKRGARGLGIELKPETAAYVRDVLDMPVVQGTLLEADLEAARFDLLVMLEYLEHEPDPLRVLTEARRVLKPGGHIVIEIPDPEGLPARLFKSRWVNLDVPRHLVFFERATLRRALKETGFEVISHRRFGLPGYIGFSMLLGLGATRIMRHWEAFSCVSYGLGSMLLPALPWLCEFSFVIARAE